MAGLRTAGFGIAIRRRDLQIGMALLVADDANAHAPYRTTWRFYVNVNLSHSFPYALGDGETHHTSIETAGSVFKRPETVEVPDTAPRLG